MRKSLSLRKETLNELTADELSGIVGASNFICISEGSCSACSSILPPITIDLPNIRIDG